MLALARATLFAALVAAATLTLAAATLLATPPAASRAAGPGEVVVQWEPVERKARRFARALRRSGGVERVAADVNRRYVLPREIPILFTSQLEVGPAYLPNLDIGGERVSFITFPGSFLVLEMAVLRRALRGYSSPKPVEAMIAANEFIVAHELGHALVDQLDLPITGKEEDAVDGFAAYLLVSSDRFGAGSALAAAIFFDGISRRPTADDFADEHSLHQQRVYQFLCWVYGSDPKAYAGLVGKRGLPRRRAVRCPAEWRQVNRSWSRLLAPHAAPVLET